MLIQKIPTPGAKGAVKITNGIGNLSDIQQLANKYGFEVFLGRTIPKMNTPSTKDVIVLRQYAHHPFRADNLALELNDKGIKSKAIKSKQAEKMIDTFVNKNILSKSKPNTEETKMLIDLENMPLDEAHALHLMDKK